MSDAALAATTQATVGILTGHTTGCACEMCDRLRFVRLPDVVQAVQTLTDEMETEALNLAKRSGADTYARHWATAMLAAADRIRRAVYEAGTA